MAGYFGELYKKDLGVYDLFEEGRSELDSLVMYRMTGEYECID